MIRRMLFLIGLVMAASTASAQTVTFDPTLAAVTPTMQALPVHVGGRVLSSPLSSPMPAGSTKFVHQWPGVYFEAAFEGSQMVMRFDDPLNEYRLLIDDLIPIQIVQPGHVDMVVSGLTNTYHRLRLEKVTESVDHSTAFEGFYISGDERAGSNPVRERRMEFIGDSAMTGYGIRSTSPQCSKEEVRIRTDTQAAYPALVSKQFGADYRINAISGRGLIRNFGGVEPDDPMSHAYGFSVRDIQAPYRDIDWQPQIIIVSLFADFAGDLNSGEKWKTMGNVGTDWANSYAEFLIRLNAQAPEASLIVGWPDMSQQTDPEFISIVNHARATIMEAADRNGFRVVMMEMPSGQGYELSGCDYHPSLNDQLRLNEHVAGFISKHPELWSGRP